MSLWDKIINQTHIDSALINDLSDISYKATNGRREKPRNLRNNIVDLGKLPFLENPPQNAITKEMILEYQKSLQEPLKDPITGDILTNRYYPSDFKYDIADLKNPPPLVDEPNLKKPATQTDVDLLYDAIKMYMDNINILKTELNKYELDLNKQKEILSTSHNKGTLKKARAQIPIIEAEILRVINNLKAEETNITTAETFIKSMETNMKENHDILIKHNMDIKYNLSKYRDSLLALNRNRLSIEEKQPNETDEDYLQRMKNLELELNDKVLYEEKANLNQIVMLKKNLRTLFNKDELIENIVKSYKPDEIYIINTYFKQIQEYFLETFGKNNTNLKLNEILDVIKSIIYKIQNPVVEYEIEEELPAAAAAAVSAPSAITSLLDTSGNPTDFNYGIDSDSFYIENNKNGKHIWFKIADVDNKKILLYSTTDNSRGNFKQVMERQTTNTLSDDVLNNIVDKYLKLDIYSKNQLLPKQYSKLNPVIDELEKKYKLTPFKSGIKIIKTARNVKRFGFGLAGTVRDPDEELPQYTDFGNLVIMPSKLYYKNILSVLMKNGHKIEGLNNTKVSNLFVDIIMDMYNNKNVSSAIKNLNTNEQHLMNGLLFKAGLHKKYTTDNNETLNYLKNKHKVIEGEILAGNNNPELVKELKDVLLKLYHLNAISLSSLKKYIQQFK